MTSFALLVPSVIETTAPSLVRMIVDMHLANYTKRRIARELGIHRQTVVNVLKRNIASLADSKTKLLQSSLRVAQAAINRVEDTIETAGCSQAAVVFGIASEKAMMYAGEPTQRIEVNLSTEDIYSELRTIQAEIIHSLKVDQSTDAQFAKLPDSSTPPSGVDRAQP